MCTVVGEWRFYDGSMFRMAFSPGYIAYLAVVFRKHPFAMPLEDYVIFVAIFSSLKYRAVFCFQCCVDYKIAPCSISSQFVDSS